MKRHAITNDVGQLGFDSLLIETDQINERAAFERKFAHLPGTMEEAVPFYCDLIARHHMAMVGGDIDGAVQLREEAHDLALRLNNGEPGILAGPDAPGCKLEDIAKAKRGDVPAWGQKGSFVIEMSGAKVRIEMDGIFGIGARYSPWMNFSAHAVNRKKPFISETGYRSFTGVQAALVAGMLPDRFAREVIATHIRKDLKGKLCAIDAKYAAKEEQTTP